MDCPDGFDIVETISRTTYFKCCLERLLLHLQPIIGCPRLVVTVLIYGPSGSGKAMLVKEAARTLNMKLFEERITWMLGDNIVETDSKIRSTIDKFTSTEPSIIYVSGLELLSYLDEGDLQKVEFSLKDSLKELSKKSTQPIIFIGATGDFDRFSKTTLTYLFDNRVAIPPASCDEANDFLNTIKLEGMMESDLSDICFNLKSLKREYYIGNLLNAISRAEIDHHFLRDPAVSTGEKKDEGTRWTDIGGLAHIKKEIIDTIQLPIDNPQFRRPGFRRIGILLHGPPGTGKTLLAKAVASECSLEFINGNGSELLNEYVGQSEENLRNLFQKARDSSPSVLFFDEIDALAPVQGRAGDSGGVMDRMVSTLQSGFDSLSECEDVYVMATTNRIDLVDPSLLRPGRFDRVLEVPLPKTSGERLQILKAITRTMELADDVDLAEIETLAKPNKSGADFQGLCQVAMRRTTNRCIELVEKGEATEDDVPIIVCRDDFMAALEEF